MHKRIGISAEDENQDKLKAFLKSCPLPQRMRLLAALIHGLTLGARKSYPIYLSVDHQPQDRRLVDIVDAERMVLFNEIQNRLSGCLLELLNKQEAGLFDEAVVDEIYGLAARCNGVSIMSAAVDFGIKHLLESREERGT